MTEVEGEVERSIEQVVTDSAAITAGRVAGSVAAEVAKSAESAVESGIQAGVSKATEIIQTDEEMRAWQNLVIATLSEVSEKIEKLSTQRPILVTTNPGPTSESENPATLPLEVAEITEAVAAGEGAILPVSTLPLAENPPVNVPLGKVRAVKRWL